MASIPERRWGVENVKCSLRGSGNEVCKELGRLVDRAGTAQAPSNIDELLRVSVA